MREEIIKQLMDYFRKVPSDENKWPGFVDGIGATNEEFEEAKRRTLEQSQPNLPKSNTPYQPIHHLNASHILLAIGIALVLVATVVIISYSWPTLSPIMRFLAIATPNAILFAISAYTSKQNELKHIREGTQATGLVMLPISVAVFLFQFGIIPELNELLMIASLAIVLPVYLFIDLIQKVAYGAILTLINVSGIITFFIMYAKIESSTVISLIYLLMAFTAFLISWYAKLVNDERHFRPYGLVASVIFFFDIPFFFSSFFFSSNGSFTAQDTIGQMVTTSLAGGSSLFIIIILIGKLFNPSTEFEYSIQRFLIIGFLLTLFGPLLSVSADQKIFSIFVIIFSILILLLGAAINVNFLFYGGIIAFIFGLLIPLTTLISGISVPILLFVIGIMAILLSIAIARSKLLKNSFRSESMTELVGIIPDNALAAWSISNSVLMRRFSGWYGCLIILIIFWIISYFFGLLFKHA